MLWTLWFGLVAALLRAAAAAASAVFQDPDTGLVFTSETLLYKVDGRIITYRVAIPDSAQNYAAFDVVVQVVVPNDVGWAGLAWGGGMTKNPLLVAWRTSSNSVVLSSRWATGHVAPAAYSGAEYTLFKTGTKSNSTHWQFTALCKGCSSWLGDTGATRYLNPRGGNRLAFVYSPTKPSGTTATSSINMHEVHTYPSPDFNQGVNSNFESTVQRLLA